MPKETKHRKIPRAIRSQRGNLAIILTVSMAMVFAVGGFALDTAMYLNKRQEVQSLAETVATAAALSFPLRHSVQVSAETWFKSLRTQGGKEIAPLSALSLIFNDNSGAVSDLNPYKLDSLTVNIQVNYVPNILPSGGALPENISILGSATTQLAPTDVVLVFENSASFYDDSDGVLPGYQFFQDKWGVNDPRVLAYGAQCFNPQWAAFKRAVVNAYDLMSQIGTFRVAVATTQSRTGNPILLSDFAATWSHIAQWPWDSDMADKPQSRCAKLTGAGGFPVPDNENSVGGFWTPRTNIDHLLNDEFVWNGGLLSFLSVRELIWITNAGYSSANGYIHPKHYYSGDRSKVFEMIDPHLTNSRRSDKQPVVQRVVLVLGDDAGAKFDKNGPGAMPISNWCASEAGDAASSKFLYGFGIYHHRSDIYGHGAAQSNFSSFKTNCSKSGNLSSGIYWDALSSVTDSNAFAYDIVPNMIQGLKQVQLSK